MSKKVDEASMTQDVVGFLANKKKKSKKLEMPWYLKSAKDLKCLVMETLADKKSNLNEDGEGKLDMNLAKSYAKLKNKYKKFQANPELQQKDPEQFKKLQQFFDKMNDKMGDVPEINQPEAYATDKTKSYLNTRIGDLPPELKAELENDVSQSAFKGQHKSLPEKATLGTLLKKLVGSKVQDREVILSPDLLDKIKSWHAQNKDSIEHAVPAAPKSDIKKQPTLGHSKVGDKTVIDPDLPDEDLKSQFATLAKQAKEKVDTEDRSLASKMKSRGASGIGRKDMHSSKESPLSMTGINQKLDAEPKKKQVISDPKGAVAEKDLDVAMAERGDTEGLPAEQELRNAYKKMAMNILHDPESNFHMDIIDGIAQRTGADHEDIEAVKEKMWPNGQFNKSVVAPPGEEKLYDAVRTYFSPSRLIKNPQFVDALRDYTRQMYFGSGHDPLVPEEEMTTGATTPQLKTVFQKMLGSASPEDADREMASMKVAEPMMFKNKYRQALKMLKHADPQAWNQELEQASRRAVKTSERDPKAKKAEDLASFTKGLDMARSSQGPDPDKMIADFQAKKLAKEKGLEPGKFELDQPQTPEEYEAMVQKNKAMNQYDRVKTRDMMKQPAPEKKRADVVDLIRKSKERMPMKKVANESLLSFFFEGEELLDADGKEVAKPKEKAWELAPLAKKKSFEPKFEKQKLPSAKK